MARKLRNIKLYILDIINSIRKINEYIIGFDFQTFSNDSKTIDAVIRNLEIIGEAATQIPIKFRNENDFIDWRALSDFRNVVIHEYFGVNIRIIWDIIKNELPALNEQITNLSLQIEDELFEWE